MEDTVYKEFLELEDGHWWFRGRRAIFISLLDTYLGRDRPEGRLVMDVGCGVGGMLQPLEKYGRTVGTDVTFQGLKHCADRGFPRLVASNGPESPFLDGVFDGITAFDALEHIEDDVGTLREFHRMLKPGGIVVASGPAYQFLYAQQDRNTHHFRRYSRGVFTSRAREAGFEIVKATYINFWLFPLILPVVLSMKLLQAIRPPAPSQDGSNVGIPIPKLANETLAAIFCSEAKLLRYFSAPTGHSLVMVARKPG
jgi:SAM-dependent methyltransferase